MKTKLMAMALLAGGAMFAQPRVSVGIGIGGYGQPAYGSPYAAQRVIPRSPGPGYVWVDGYWSHDRARRVWISGYWQKPRYEQRGYGNDRRDSDRGRSFGNGYRNR